MTDVMLNAVLSMDAYNRGYGAGILVDNISPFQTGSAYFVADSSELSSSHEDIGFYAVAYDVYDSASQEHSTVISYRGTDHPNPLANDSDVTNGWLVGAGNYNASQATMAVRFYKAIVQDYLAVADDLNTVGIYTTGHSLGGGLASYVSAIYGQTATAFDSMEYLTAVENMHFYATEILETDPQYITISKPIIDLIYDVAGPQDVWDIDHTKVTAYHLQGEVLHPDFARQQPSQEVTFSGAINLVNIPDAPSFIIDPSLRTLYELGAAAGEVVLESVARHDMATLVIRMFADTDEVQRNQWSAAADYIYPVMFDAQFATVLGFKDHASVAGSLQQGGN